MERGRPGSGWLRLELVHAGSGGGRSLGRVDRDGSPAAGGGDIRCSCNSLLARLVAGGVELKCRRCRQAVTLRFVPAESAGEPGAAGAADTAPMGSPPSGIEQREDASR